MRKTTDTDQDATAVIVSEPSETPVLKFLEEPPIKLETLEPQHPCGHGDPCAGGLGAVDEKTS